ncbi:MAG: endo alpha-1,4 polygalactosaminidase [Deltaproteobacteria bacterium]|nr:endo alpha-1,4 polygalactosaminidase [Deltaproteobacteria bacterium]
MVESRLDKAPDKACDGVEPDNMDGYVNDTGFDFTGTDQLDFPAHPTPVVHFHVTGKAQHTPAHPTPVVHFHVTGKAKNFLRELNLVTNFE